MKGEGNLGGFSGIIKPGSIWEGMKESTFEGFPPLMVHCLGWCPIMTSGFHTPH